MSTLTVAQTMISDSTRAVQTRVDTKTPVTVDAQSRHPRTDWTEAWDDVEGKLIEWGRDPSEIYEEGTLTPGGETLRQAIRLASTLGQQGCRAPTRVVPNAHGGIVFELQGKNTLESLHVSPDGSIERRLFVNHRLILREPWPLETVKNQ